MSSADRPFPLNEANHCPQRVSAFQSSLNANACCKTCAAAQEVANTTWNGSEEEFISYLKEMNDTARETHDELELFGMLDS